MAETQTMIAVDVAVLRDTVKEYQAKGYRFVQLGATRTDHIELNYSFDKNYEFVNVRVTLATSAVPVPSVSGIYWCAFLYENEIHDLYGITFTDIAIDYQGKFYRTAVKHPFGERHE